MEECHQRGLLKGSIMSPVDIEQIRESARLIRPVLDNTIGVNYTQSRK